MTFDNVWFDAPAQIRVAAEFANLIYGPGPMNLPVGGEDVRIGGKAAKGEPNACRDRFVPLPE